MHRGVGSRGQADPVLLPWREVRGGRQADRRPAAAGPGAVQGRGIGGQGSHQPAHMNRLRQWLEDRLGLSMFEEFGQKQLYKPVPAHANYAFTLGTAALVVFMTQVASGILLAMNYSSGLEQAHVSVHNITFVLPA